jgi:hypothetical protein
MAVAAGTNDSLDERGVGAGAATAVRHHEGDVLIVRSGELAIFSAAADGIGPYSTPLTPAQVGPVPVVHGPPTREADPGLLLPTNPEAYELKVRWYTRSCS